MRKVVTDCLVRTVVMVAGTKRIGLVQLVDGIEIVTSCETTDEGFHPCFAWNVSGDGL